MTWKWAAMIVHAISAAAVVTFAVEYYFHCHIQCLHAEIIHTKARSTVFVQLAAWKCSRIHNLIQILPFQQWNGRWLSVGGSHWWGWFCLLRMLLRSQATPPGWHSPNYQMCFLCVQFVKRALLPSLRPISSALDVTSRSTRHVHSSASGQFLLRTSDTSSKCTRLIESFFFYIYIF